MGDIRGKFLNTGASLTSESISSQNRWNQLSQDDVDRTSVIKRFQESVRKKAQSRDGLLHGLELSAKSFRSHWLFGHTR